VVVVTVNHRLASLGYLHLADLGAPPEFKNAGVAGMMDLVASLEWVRDNIENFGGDPAKVMIFGQSGGGAKTSTMLAIPSAKGLYHSAGIQSGSTIRSATREEATKSAELLLAKLGIGKGNIAAIQKKSWQEILQAQTGLQGAVFTPVVDGTILPHHPFDPAAPPESADVPIIISNTLEDAALRLTNWDLTEEGLRTMMNQRYGQKAEPMIQMYRARYPDKSPYLIQAQINTDATSRRSAILQAERKSEQGKAPAYMYLWAYASGGFGGKFGAVHGTDVSATFNNYRDGVGGTGTTEERALFARFSNAWVSMAKTANPNNSKIPNWPGYDAKNRATMIFDREIRLENDPRSEMRKFWAEMPRA
jgi:para-nitrobenzyl esterase